MSKEKLKERTDKIKELALNFCTQKLDKSYGELTEKVIDKLSRKRPSPLLKGKLEIWAAAVIHSLGNINFLYDKSFKPYLTFDELNDFFGTKKSTVGNKASDIRKMLKMDMLSSFGYMTDRRKENHPLYNSVMVDGFIVSISSLPEEYQKIAREAKARGEDIHFTTG